jgi:hypothetical protein
MPSASPPGRAWRRVLLGAGALAFVTAVPAGAQWRGELWLGDAWSLPTRLTISQINQPEISTVATWSTRPFVESVAWYYAFRVSHWSDNAAWAFEDMHHKLYLDNPPPGVAYLRVTNGVNFFLAERLWRRHGWEFGVGAGPVLAVPISEVRDLIYNNAHGFFHSQYQLAGPGFQVSLQRRMRLLPFTYGMLALKATAAPLYLDVADGHATTSNFALHVQYGLSLQSRSR